MNKFLKVLVIVLGIGLSYGIILYFVIQESKECDEHVILTGNESYDCRSVSSFSNGMSCIRFCDGAEMNVPTNRIVEVRKLK
jgi:hypothetical protein